MSAEPPKGRPIKQPCCKAWALAHEWGTDNEGHLSLVYYASDDGRAHIGYVGAVDPGVQLEPVNYCPWCGAKKD